MGAGASADARNRSHAPKLSTALPTGATSGAASPSVGAEYLTVLKSPVFGLKTETQLILRIAYEALVLLDTAKVPQQHFPYQSVICWGSTSKIFQFRLFGSYFNRQSETIGVALGTPLGQHIQTKLLEHVKALMQDMDASGVSKDDFKVLTNEMLRYRAESGVDPSNDGFGNAVATAQLETVRQFGQGRKFLAKQAIELLAIIGDGAPFERVEMAVFLYGRLLNPSSFQLVLNQFSDAGDRRNVMHRLKLDISEESGTAVAHGVQLHVECAEGLGSKKEVFQVPVPEYKKKQEEPEPKDKQGSRENELSNVVNR